MLSREEYLETEAKYLRAAHRFMAGASVANLRAHEVEHWDEPDDALVALALDDIFDGSVKPNEGEELSSSRFDNAFRRCFREAAWLEFYCDQKFLIHLGHELRLTIATEGSFGAESAETRDDGLFVYPGTPNLPTLETWLRKAAGW